MFKALFFAALGGILLAASFPAPWATSPALWQTVLAFGALAPLLWALEGPSWRRGALLGWVFGLFWFAPHCGWIFSGGVSSLGLLIWAALVSYGALYPALFAALATPLMTKRYPWQALWVPALWALSELAREKILTGIPAFSLGSTQVDDPWLLPLAGVLGVGGLSFAVALVNLSLARLAKGTWSRREKILALGTALSLAALTAAQHPPAPTAPALPIALLQGNVAILDHYEEAASDEMMEIYSRLSIDAGYDGANLLIWPEGVFPEDLGKQGARADIIADFARRKTLNVLVGGSSEQRSGAGQANVALLLTKDGEKIVYQKRRLVPFMEALPAWAKAILPRRLTKPFVDEEYQPGSAWQPMQASGLALSPAICFESLFGDELRRDPGGLLVVLASDAFFHNSHGPQHHLAQARLRAVEGGRWVAHCVAQGPSALIDPSGRMVQSLAQGTRGSIRGEVDGRSGSPYRRWGAWVPLLWLSLLLLPVIVKRP